jgi:hypothetical protein
MSRPSARPPRTLTVPDADALAARLCERAEEVVDAAWLHIESLPVRDRPTLRRLREGGRSPWVKAAFPPALLAGGLSYAQSHLPEDTRRLAERLAARLPPDGLAAASVSAIPDVAAAGGFGDRAPGYCAGLALAFHAFPARVRGEWGPGTGPAADPDDGTVQWLGTLLAFWFDRWWEPGRSPGETRRPSSRP